MRHYSANVVAPIGNKSVIYLPSTLFRASLYCCIVAAGRLKTGDEQ